MRGKSLSGIGVVGFMFCMGQLMCMGQSEPSAI